MLKCETAGCDNVAGFSHSYKLAIHQYESSHSVLCCEECVIKWAKSYDGDWEVNHFWRCLHPETDIAMDDAISIGIQAMACYAAALERMDAEMRSEGFVWSGAHIGWQSVSEITATMEVA